MGGSEGRGRRGAAIVLLAVLVPALAALSSAGPAVGQDEAGPATGNAIGAGEPGAIAFEVVGRIERRASSVTAYGFLTHLAGLTAEELFTDPAAPSAETARFTFFGSADPVLGVALDDVTVFASTGELGIYYNPSAGASFEVAESFFSGTQVAGAGARFHEVLVGDPAELRLVDTFAELVLVETEPFALDGGPEVQLGAPGARLHLRGAGLEEPAAEGASRTTTTFAGRAVVAPAGELDVVSAEVQPTDTDEVEATEPAEVEATPEEDEATEAATSETGGVDCAEAEQWLVETLGRVGRARTLVTPVLQVLDDAEADAFAELEPAALRDAADELNELAEAQQAADAPAGAEDPGRSLTSAMEAFARGLNLLATAVANENADALDQARALVLDADEALAGGSALLAELAQACDIRR